MLYELAQIWSIKMRLETQNVMNIRIIILTLLMASYASVASAGDELKEKSVYYISTQEEMELLKEYATLEETEITIDTILIYNEDFELIHRIDEAFHELSLSDHQLVSESNLLMDDGNTMIYQTQHK